MPGNSMSVSTKQQRIAERVRDGVLNRLSGKWLKAGVMEEGNISYPDSGSPH